MHRSAALLLPLLLLTTTATAGAQGTAPADRMSGVAGVVVNGYGEPVAYAQVYLADGSASSVADDSGRFRIEGLPAGSADVGVRRIGYEPLAFRVELPDSSIVHVRVRLTQIIARLSEVRVEDARMPGLIWFGFYDRHKQGFGTFFLPEDLAKVKPSRTTDVLRGVQGIRVDTRSSPETVLFGRSEGQVCPLAVFIDDYFTPGALDEVLRPEMVLAVEVYGHAAQTPVRYIRSGTCGAVVIWTTWIRWIEQAEISRRRAEAARRSVGEPAAESAPAPTDAPAGAPAGANPAADR